MVEENNYLKLNTRQEVAEKVRQNEGQLHAEFRGAYGFEKGEEGEIYEVEEVEPPKNDFCRGDFAMKAEFDRRKKLDKDYLTLVVEFSKENAQKYGEHILLDSWNDYFDLVTDDEDNNRIIYERDGWNERIICHTAGQNQNIIKEVELKEIEDKELVSQML